MFFVFFWVGRGGKCLGNFQVSLLEFNWMIMFQGFGIFDLVCCCCHICIRGITQTKNRRIFHKYIYTASKSAFIHLICLIPIVVEFQGDSFPSLVSLTSIAGEIWQLYPRVLYEYAKRTVCLRKPRRYVSLVYTLSFFQETLLFSEFLRVKKT